MPLIDMQKIIDKQRVFFRSGVTLDVRFRLDALRKLRRVIIAYEGRLSEALSQDLGKCAAESYMSEIGMTLAGIREMRRHLRRWSSPRRVAAPLAQFPSSCRILPESYGLVLVISPWNYPALLSLDPIVSAVGAGNCCVLKPSELAPHTSRVLAELLAEAFPPELVSVVQGGVETSSALLAQRWDYIFFTGGAEVGKVVMEAAAKHLTPTTLELGGKSPCIVDSSADVEMAARRIAFGKILNAGQTCVAPDYALVHSSVLAPFVEAYRKAVAAMVGETPLQNAAFPRIVNARHHTRLMGLMQGAEIWLGGRGDAETLRIEPTLLGGVRDDSPCMREEIFGPLLPVLPFEQLSEAEERVLSRPKPLACYIFTQNDEVEKRLLSRLSFGGGCINDTVIHLAVPGLPFGGVGESGMGAYHGKAGFDTFTHYKSVLKKGLWLDFPFRYQPFNAFKNRILRLFLR